MLACFRGIPAVQEYFRSEYELELTARQIGAYDPNRSYYEAGDKWRELFEAKRKAYLEEVASVPIANQGFRLNVLHEQLEKAISKNQAATVAMLLKQAAEEVGGVLTNERNLRVDDSRRQRASEMTPEDRKAAVAELIRQALEGRDPPGAAPAPAALQ